ncbi:hypothetical protein BSFA1_54600 [Burkholderia sp. SFA1]|nr:hypothetical protein BSFA1_54600 [Burkholderia sp. SFA1]
MKAVCTASLSKFSANTVRAMADPGTAIMYQAVRSASRPVPTIEPQLTTFGSPRPRNDRAA